MLYGPLRNNYKDATIVTSSLIVKGFIILYINKTKNLIKSFVIDGTILLWTFGRTEGQSDKPKCRIALHMTTFKSTGKKSQQKIKKA